jgi:uncharacterized protein (TIGR03437 family)
MSRNAPKSSLWTLFLASHLCCPAFPQDVITTTAGTDFVFTGNGRPALDVPLALVFGVAADPSGNVFLCSSIQALVMKVTPHGTLTVVAGNGIQGFSGDDGPATNASLNYPTGLAVDANGNLYIADSNNNRVRKVTPDGNISTFAGNGVYGYMADGVPAMGTALAYPIGLATDTNGNVYIADRGNSRIRKVATNGIISTVAGNGKSGFAGDKGPASAAMLNEPTDVAVDTLGNLYIVDNLNFRIRKVSTDQSITTIAGNGKPGFSGDKGPATQASLNAPIGVAVDASGNVYISDTGNQRIRQVTSAGTITTLAGTGERNFSGDGKQSTAASIADPQLMAVDPSGNLYIADQSNSRVRKVSSQGTITTFAGSGAGRFAGDGGPSYLAVLDDPQGIAIDQAGNLYIADTVNNRVRKVGADGIISTVAGNGQATFAGDGGLAIHASMVTARAAAVDNQGNIYIADRDNNRIRKVTPGGKITTVAGNGQATSSGDGGPAAAAAVNSPSGVALDAAGNLFIAADHRVRKVSADGTISTFAGTGQSGFSGDGGLAVNAQLSNPTGIATDPSGNLYIADQNNHRIRKVTADGKIDTIAGTGPPGLQGGGFSGDGGPATSALLNNPVAVAIDAAGNVYIADFNNDRIRRISSNSSIATVAGAGQIGFAGDGGPAPNALLNQPAGVAVDAEGRIYIADSANNRIRVVLTTPPTIQISANQLSFSANSTGPPTAVQTIQLSSHLPGIPFSTSVTTKDGGNWLHVNPVTLLMPTPIEVSADPGSLKPGSYSGTVTFSAPLANPISLEVAVTFQVGPAQQAAPALQPQALSFSYGPGSGPATQQLRVLNAGGGALPFKAVAATASGGNWLAVTPSNGTATPASPASLTVTADPTGLSTGTYSGQILIGASGSLISTNVTMIVSANEQTIVLSQTGLTFMAIAGGGTVPSQQFGVLNSGTGPMKWSATVTTGAKWLSVTPSQGTSDPTAAVAFVQVQVNPKGLAADTYFGLIQVAAQSADNSPQFVSVVLRVSEEANIVTASPIVVEPAGLIFTGTAGGTSPGSQKVQVYNLSSNPLAFSSGRATLPSGNWFVNSPATASVAPSEPVTIEVQTDLSGLPSGIYRGALTLIFDDFETRIIDVLLVVAPAEGSALKEANTTAPACKPKQLLPVFTSIANGFAVPASFPAAILVQVVDNCGNAMITGSVSASFSDADPELSLLSLDNGMWSATWQSQSVGADVTVTITAITAITPKLNISGTIAATGGVQLNQDQPFLTKVANLASLLPGVPVAPGSLISLFGGKLATGQASASAPLSVQLANSQAAIRGELLPLAYASDTQINAQIPFDVPLNTQLQLLVLPGNQITTPYPLIIAEASPAIFTADGSGKGQGDILDGQFKLVQPGNPASAGDLIHIYCTGLGAVNPPISAGVAAPQSPLSKTVNSVKATVGGVSAKVVFAGLEPGTAGRYQVDAFVPAGVTPANAVPVKLIVAGQTSPPVTIALK